MHARSPLTSHHATGNFTLCRLKGSYMKSFNPDGNAFSHGFFAMLFRYHPLLINLLIHIQCNLKGGSSHAQDC